MMQRRQRKHLGTFCSLHDRNFRLYFLGQLFSISGNNAQVVALGWLVLELSNSGTALGVVMAAQFLPTLLASPVMGSLVDSFDKRRILVGAQLCGLVFAILLGILAATGTATVERVALISFLIGMVNAVDFPARNALVGEMVQPEMLPNAIALNNVLMGLARVAGPALAGAVISFAGIPVCFFVNAFSFLVIVMALLVMRFDERDRGARCVTFAGVLDGFRYAYQTPPVRSGLLVMAVVGMFTYEFWITFPLLVRHTFHGSAAQYSTVMAVMSVGSITGGLLIARHNVSGAKAAIASVAGFGATTMLVGLMPSIGFVFPAVFLMGCAYSAFVALNSAVLQMHTDLAYRGRVMGLWTAAFAGSTAIGGPITGAIAQGLGVRVALLFGGFVAVGVASLSSRRFLRLRNANATDEEKRSSWRFTPT